MNTIVWVWVVAGHIAGAFPSQGQCLGAQAAGGGQCVAQQQAPSPQGMVCVQAMPGQMACYPR